MMLTKHTVQWFYADDERRTPQVTVYITPNHHTMRERAETRNNDAAYNRQEYDDACAMGRAVVFKHDKEPDDGEA